MKLKRILAAALALLMLLAAFAGCSVKKAESGGKTEETEKTSGGREEEDYGGVPAAYFEAFADGDEDAVAELLYPPLQDLWEQLYGEEDGLVEELDGNYGLYGSKVKSWEISQVVELDEDELEELQDEVDDVAETLGKKLKKVQDAVVIVAEASIRGEGEMEFYFNLIKAGGKWYIASFDEIGL